MDAEKEEKRKIRVTFTGFSLNLLSTVEAQNKAPWKSFFLYGDRLLTLLRKKEEKKKEKSRCA